MRGDRVLVVMDTGGGTSREFTVEATKDGRTVEVKQVRQTVEVSELMRTGSVVRTSLFMASRVIACVEIRADERDPEAGEQLRLVPSEGTR